jgi:hypothetical protein
MGADLLRRASLPDPRKLFNAGLGGNQWRAIDFHEGDKVTERALKTLVRAPLHPVLAFAVDLHDRVGGMLAAVFAKPRKQAHVAAV